MKSYGYVLFYSTSAALRTEKVAKISNIPVKLVSVPRQLGSDCGVCIQFDTAYEEGIRELLESKRIEYSRIHI
jgi:hypothetical protein